MEKVLLLNLQNKEYGRAMINIFEQLGVKVINVLPDQILEQVGYLVQEDDYSSTERKPTTERIEDEMIVFFNFNDDQMNLVLEVFKQANLPYVPLKAIVTNTNIEWTLLHLHHAIKKEFEEMRGAMAS